MPAKLVTVSIVVIINSLQLGQNCFWHHIGNLTMSFLRIYQLVCSFLGKLARITDLKTAMETLLPVSNYLIFICI